MEDKIDTTIQEEIPKNIGENPQRNPDGTFAKGNTLSPGRPKGTSIKDRIRKYLEEHPDDMQAFVEHFAKNNRELAWQMLEGRPHQAIGGSDELPELNLGVVMLPKKDESTLDTTSEASSSPS